MLADEDQAVRGRAVASLARCETNSAAQGIKQALASPIRFSESAPPIALSKLSPGHRPALKF